VDTPLGRSDRFWVAYGGGGSVYLPLIVVDSGNQFSSGHVDISVYRGMVNTALARPPLAILDAVAWQYGSRVRAQGRITNTSGFSLSYSANRASLYLIVYEDIRVGVTNRYVRAVASVTLSDTIANDGSADFAIETSDLSGVIWSNLHAVVIADYRPGVTTGAYDTLQAAQWPVPTSPFTDVPDSHLFFPWIEKIFVRRITAGCATDLYCPDTGVSRAQMAVFLEKGMRGSTYLPPAATGHFDDVPADHWAAGWIEQLSTDGITAGCGATAYCPDQIVSRAQMAVFLLKAKHGRDYTPPAPTGLFLDVPTSHWAGAWIEQLSIEGITAGCGGGSFCPDSPVTRGQMAVFLSNTFGY